MFVNWQLPEQVLVKCAGVHVNTSIKAEPAAYMSSGWEGSQLFGVRLRGDAHSSKSTYVQPWARRGLAGGSTLQWKWEDHSCLPCVQERASRILPGCPRKWRRAPWKRDCKGMSPGYTPVPPSGSLGPSCQLLWALLPLLTLFQKSGPMCNIICGDLVSRGVVKGKKRHEKGN